jgi:ArsR family transcriptional regulator
VTRRAVPASSPVIAIFAALADPQRARMLRLLERSELAVGELASALQLPQSTMSRHLKALHTAGIVGKRAEGTATLYRLSREAISPEARSAWDLLRASIDDAAAFADDDRRMTEVLAARNPDPKGFFGRVGGEWSVSRRRRCWRCCLRSGAWRTSVAGPVRSPRRSLRTFARSSRSTASQP